METQLNLKHYISRNNLDDLASITKLVREGWDIIHFDNSTEMKGKDTVIILIRKM